PAPESPAAPGKSTGASGGAWKAVGWILGMTVIGALAFLLINNVKLSDMRKRLMDFSKEIIPLIPRQAARKLGINNENNKKNE
nr:stage II sporulation protein P [Bacillota bacterium]